MRISGTVGLEKHWLGSRCQTPGSMCLWLGIRYCGGAGVPLFQPNRCSPFFVIALGETKKVKLLLYKVSESLSLLVQRSKVIIKFIKINLFLKQTLVIFCPCITGEENHNLCCVFFRKFCQISTLLFHLVNSSHQGAVGSASLWQTRGSWVRTRADALHF